MDFSPKSTFFLWAFFTEIVSEKMIFRYFKLKTIIFRPKKKSITRAKKWTFCKGVSPWILSKNRTFCYRCFSQKLCEKRSCFDILDRKQSFLDQKIEVLTRARKWTFFKGVSPWILPKKRTFSYRRVSQKSHQKRLFLTM